MPGKIVEELKELRERQEEFEDDTFEILGGEYQKVVDDLARELEKAADKLETDARGNFKGDTKIVVDARKAEAKAEAALTTLWTRWQDRLGRLTKQQVDYTAKAQGEPRPRSLPKQEQEVAEALLGLWPKGDQAGSGVAGQFYNLGAKHRRDLADAVTRHVLGRAPKAKLVRELAEKTERSKAQAEQLIRDSTMQFSRTIKANNSDRYEFFEYDGPNDGVTRDFCRRHVGRVYTRAEIDAMDNGQTGAGTVFIAGGGYNCRHAWFPVQREWFTPEEWASIRDAAPEPTWTEEHWNYENAGQEPEKLTEPNAFGTHLGRVSGRPFNLEELALPIEKLSLKGTKFSEEGLQEVKQHLLRFGPDEGNEKMLSRLEAIVSGERLPEDVDVRFYSHELRELERYTAAGWRDGVPDDEQEAARLWNNEHSATLEEFGINEDDAPLYVRD